MRAEMRSSPSSMIPMCWSIAALRQGGRAYVSGLTERFTALAVEELPTEFRGYGDPVALANLMGQVSEWGCLEVEADLAQAVAQRLRDTSGNAVRFYGSVYLPPSNSR